jgi:hypothetical protein
VSCAASTRAINCPSSADWLQQFTQHGNYKLVDEIAEIWTHIPHLQGVSDRGCKGQR